MLNQKQKDIICAMIIGEISAWLMLAIAKNIIRSLPFWWLLPIVSPILCGLGMVIALAFKKRLAVLYQFAKFILVGGLNFLIDLGVLNLLISTSGIKAGVWYSVFKGISFLIATANSYFWNKLWTFQPLTSLLHNNEVKNANKEFGQFLMVSIVGFLINVGVASLIVNIIGSPLTVKPEIWANVGAMTGSIAGLMWNFIGYKLIVFR